MMSLKILLPLATIMGLNLAKPLRYDEDYYEPAASEQGQGRVQIKVFRGPSEQDGDQSFAPWGYWIKQPADDRYYD